MISLLELGEKFGLSTGSSGDGLRMTTVGNNTSSKDKTVSSSRAAITEVIRVGRVDKTTKLERRCALWERGKLSITFGKSKWNVRQGEIRSGAPVVHNTPMEGVAEVEGNTFRTLVVLNLGGSSREFGKRSDGITNVGASGDVGVQELTKQRAVREAHFFGEGDMLRRVFDKAGGGVLHSMVIQLSRNGSNGREPSLLSVPRGVVQLCAANKRRM